MAYGCNGGGMLIFARASIFFLYRHVPNLSQDLRFVAVTMIRKNAEGLSLILQKSLTLSKFVDATKSVQIHDHLKFNQKQIDW